MGSRIAAVSFFSASIMVFSSVVVALVANAAAGSDVFLSVPSASEEMSGSCGKRQKVCTQQVDDDIIGSGACGSMDIHCIAKVMKNIGCGDCVCTILLDYPPDCVDCCWPSEVKQLLGCEFSLCALAFTQTG